MIRHTLAILPMLNLNGTALGQAIPESFVLRTALSASSGQAIGDTSPVDLDGDGRPEFPFGSAVPSLGVTSHKIGYWKLHGNGAASKISIGSVTVSWLIPAFTLRWQPVAFGDVDKDGDADMLVLSSIWPGGAIAPPIHFPPTIWMNDGLGGFTENRRYLTDLGPNLGGVFHDVDMDGYPDLIMDGMSLYMNRGSRFVDETALRISGLQATTPGNFCVLDADHDGDYDILVEDQYQQMVLYVNDGTGRFQGVQQPFGLNSARMVTLDADGDGWQDVLMLQPERLYLSRPGMTTLSPAPYMLPTMTASFVARNAQVADFDQDGDLDVIGRSSTTPGVVLYWESTGSGFVDRSSTMPAYPMTGNYAGFLADFDLDGDLDVAFGVSMQGQVLLSNTYREAVTVVPPTRGGQYTVDFYAQANHLMLVAFGIGEGNLGLPGFGRWYLDPNLTTLVGVLPFPTRSKQPLTVTIPNLPALQGLRVAMQALDIDLATGKAQTTNAPFSTIP
jgi:hypothetical protein